MVIKTTSKGEQCCAALSLFSEFTSPAHTHTHTHSHIHTHSFGEVVLRSNKPVDDTASETLLSTGGTHPQVLTQVGGIAGRDGERFESEKLTHRHQGGDLEQDRNQTTSEQDTLINEDSNLTLTQTLSSSTSVTLTEISQIEPTMSAPLVPVDEVQSEQHTCTCITEALTEPSVARETAVDHSDGHDGIGSGGGDGGDGGAKKEGLLSSLRSSQMLPTDADSADCQVPPSNPNDIIGDIVRTEMRKILEVHLYVVYMYLSPVALKAMAPTCTCTC